jgi:hypothetical protein
MSSQILGGNAQEWVNRGARERAFARFSGSAFLASAIFNVVLVGALCYVASLPREVPYWLSQTHSGAYENWPAAAPNDAGTRYMIACWLADWRIANNDPHSLSFRRTAALIARGSGDEVARQVRAHDQEVLDGGLVVTPTVRTMDCSGYECAADWDETVKGASGPTTRFFHADITIGFDSANTNLRNDPLLNPFGLYVKSLRIAEMPHAR